MARRRKFRVRFNKNFSIGRVVSKITMTILTLYVGGTVLTEIGNVLVNTSSPFYKGLTLIGWTVGNVNYNGSHYETTCGSGVYTATSSVSSTCVTATTGSGILAVVGIIGISSIVMEFVNFKM